MVKKLFLFMLSMAAALTFASTAFAQLPSGLPLEGDPGVGNQPLQSNPFTSDLVDGVGQGLPNEYTRQDATNPIALVNRLIRIALSFVAVILIVLLVRAGFLWMTAAGNEDQVATAKTSIRNAMIGLIVIFCTYSFVWFLGRRIQVATQSYGRGGFFQSFGNSVNEGLRNSFGN